MRRFRESNNSAQQDCQTNNLKCPQAKYQPLHPYTHHGDFKEGKLLPVAVNRRLLTSLKR